MTSPSTPRWQAFFADLKRRKVFRVAAVYGATAFGVMQVADLVFPRLSLPDWTVTLVVALGLLGFPLATGLAWAFEKGPDGVRRTRPAGAGELDAIVREPRSRRWPAGLAALAGAALLAGGATWTVSRDGETGPYDSIVVLPLANLSGNPEDEYFGDGLAEELLNALSGIEGLKVVARTSAFAFKGANTDVRTIGDTLDVATVLEGSVRRSADRVRITAQLIDARTGYHLWSNVYDRPLTDLFAVQNAIAAEIVDALAIRLGNGQSAEALHRGGTADVQAYDLYLLGRQKWATRQIPLLHEAVSHFEGAIARDSSFALAWSGLADAIDALAWRHSPDALSRVGEAKEAAQRAILLDPDLAEGWASLGVLLTEFDQDWRFGELALRRAVTLKPSYASAHAWLAFTLLYSGRPTEALEPARRTVELDPLAGVGRSSLAHTLFALRRWPEARRAYLHFRDAGFASHSTPAVRLVSAAPHFGFTADEAEGYAREWAKRVGYSRPDEADLIGRAVFDPLARDSARAVLRRMEAAGIRPRDLAELHLVLGDPESAIVLLERAFEQRDPVLIQLGIDPVFDPVRRDRRFIRLMEALRVPNGTVGDRSQP